MPLALLIRQTPNSQHRALTASSEKDQENVRQASKTVSVLLTSTDALASGKRPEEGDTAQRQTPPSHAGRKRRVLGRRSCICPLKALRNPGASSSPKPNPQTPPFSSLKADGGPSGHQSPDAARTLPYSGALLTCSESRERASALTGETPLSGKCMPAVWPAQTSKKHR